VDASDGLAAFHRAIRFHAAGRFSWSTSGKTEGAPAADGATALYGSIERFFGILIEHYAAPSRYGWRGAGHRAPDHRPPDEYARDLRKQLDAGASAPPWTSAARRSLKIRDAQLQKIPYMLVVGDREQQSGKVAVRNRKLGDQGASVADFHRAFAS